MKTVIKTFVWACLMLCSVTLFAQNADEKAIKDAMHKQELDWNKGDIDAFMQGYWNSEELTFIGKNGIKKGWQTTLNNYKKSYPNKDMMGELTFKLLELKPLSADTYYVVGEWHLKRKQDNPGGIFTLIWKKINGAWVIVSDHTS